MNGVITYSPDTEAPYALDTVAGHTCNHGYRLVGVQTRVCENVGTAVGEFSEEPPVCQRKTRVLHVIEPACLTALDKPCFYINTFLFYLLLSLQK